jgi:hypothetical protein
MRTPVHRHSQVVFELGKLLAVWFQDSSFLSSPLPAKVLNELVTWGPSTSGQSEPTEQDPGEDHPAHAAHQLIVRHIAPENKRGAMQSRTDSIDRNRAMPETELAMGTSFSILKRK